MTIPKRFCCLISFFLFFTLLFQSFTPTPVLAQEVISEPTEVVEVVPTDLPAQTAELSVGTPTPTEAPAPTPELIAESTPEVTPEPTVEITPTPEVSLELEQVEDPEQSRGTTPTPEPTSGSDPQVTLWVEVDGDTSTTSENVSEGIDYRFRDTNLVVRFTKVTQPGKLTIKQVKLTPEQIAATGALSDTAYDITSDMANGTFLYDLTLPLPQQTTDPVVKFAASTDSLSDSQNMTQTKEIKTDSVTIRGLNHFTIFFVTSGDDRATDGTWCDEPDSTCTFGEEESLKLVDEDGLDISSVTGIPGWSSSYFDSQYVQFNFDNPELTDLTINNARLKLVYKTNSIEADSDFGATLVISDDDDFEDPADYEIITVSPTPATTTEQSFLIPFPPEYQDDSKLANLKTRFHLWGVADTGLVTTSFNQMILVVPPPTPELVFPPDGSLIRASDAILDWNDVTDILGEPVTYEYKSSWTGGNYGSVSTGTISQIDARDNASGTYYWQVRSCNGLDNCSDWSGPWEVTIDGTPPTTPGAPLTSLNPTNQTSQVWNWSASTDSNGIFQYLWEVVGGPSGTVSDTSLTTNLGEGIWSLSIKAEDNSGNQSNEANSSLTVDTTKPTNGFLSINDGALYTNSLIVDLSISATDNLTDVSQMKLKNVGDGYTDWLPFATEYTSWELTDEDGEKKVRARFKDGAGNENHQFIASDTIVLDRVAPNSSTTSPEYFNGEYIPVSFTADDVNGEVDISGVSETALWYRFNGGDWTDSDMTMSGPSGTFDFFPEEGEGTYDYYTIATDNAGNQEPENYTEDDESVSPDSTTIFDATKPESIITSPANEESNSIIYTNDWGGAIAGAAMDNDGSGLSRIELSIKRASDDLYWDGESWSAFGEEEPRVTASSTSDWNYFLPEPVEDSYEITSHAIDNAENVEDSYKLTVVLDKTIPRVTISLDPTTPDGGNNWYKTNPTITLIAIDANNDHIEHQRDSQIGDWTVYGGSFKTLAEGDHTLYYRAFDLAGNVSDTGIKNIKYDQTGLTNGPKNVSVSPNPTSGTTAKVTWEAAADNVGVEKYEVNWSLDGTSTSHTDTVGNGIREHDINKLDQGGKWNVTITAFDYAGNKKSGSTELTVDRGAPAAPILRLGSIGTGEVGLNWTKVSDATDYVIWYGNISGTYLYGARVGNVENFTVRGLGGGDYYFVIKSIDSAGNQSGYSNEVNTSRLGGAPGIAPETPAEGFSPKVKGASTEVTPTETISPTPGVLGDAKGKNIPRWLVLSLLGFSGLTAWFFFRRD